MTARFDIHSAQKALVSVVKMETVENLEGVVDILNKKWHNLVQT